MPDLLADAVAQSMASMHGAEYGRLLARSVPDMAAEDSRRLREARMLPEKGPLNEAQINFVRSSVRAFAQEREIETATLARKANYSASVVSQFLAGTYQGDLDKVARKLNRTIEQLARGEDPLLPSGYITTTQTTKILGLAALAQRTKKIAMYTGPSGAGKTMVAQAIVAGACAGVANAVHIKITSSHGSPREFLRLIAQSIDAKPTSGTRARILEGVLSKLAGTDWLLIIDDAQRLSVACDEIILDLVKIAGVPILTLDTLEFDERLSREERIDGQYARQIIQRYNAKEEQDRDGGEPMFTVDDVVSFARLMQVRLSGDAAEWAQDLACNAFAGTLGRLATVLVAAKMYALEEASQRSAEPGGIVKIDLRHLLAAWQSARGHKALTQYEQARRVRNVAARKTRVA